MLLFHVSLIHIHEELREAEDFVFLRGLQLHADGGGASLRRCLHSHPCKHTPKAERRECRFVDVLEVRVNGGRATGPEQVHRLQKRRGSFLAKCWVHREPRDLGGAQADGADNPAIFLDREMGPLFLRREREVAIEVDLEVARRKIRAAGDEGPPVGVGLRRLQRLQAHRHTAREGFARHQGSRRGDFIREEALRRDAWISRSRRSKRSRARRSAISRSRRSSRNRPPSTRARNSRTHGPRRWVDSGSWASSSPRSTAARDSTPCVMRLRSRNFLAAMPAPGGLRPCATASSVSRSFTMGPKSRSESFSSPWPEANGDAHTLSRNPAAAPTRLRRGRLRPSRGTTGS